MRVLPLCALLALAACPDPNDTLDPDGDGYSVGDGDCAPNDPTIYPTATEDCDGVDDDCDGTVDEDPGGGVTYYLDADEDGYGVDDTTVVACSAPAGYSLDAGDCDDSRASAYPGAPELCNEVDDDCDNDADEGVTPPSWYLDADEDGYGSDDFTPVVACEPPDDGFVYVQDNTDCRDAAPAYNPGATEVCDGVDGNCDGVPDDGLFVDCPITTCQGVAAGEYWIELGDWSGNETPAVTYTECDGVDRLLFTTHVAADIGLVGVSNSSRATIQQVEVNGDAAYAYRPAGDTADTGCDLEYVSTLVDLPFVTTEMGGTITVSSTGSGDADDDWAWNTGTDWIPPTYTLPSPQSDCPGGIMVGTDFQVFKQPGTWGVNWSLAASPREITAPGLLSGETRQLRVTVADHTRGTEEVTVSWALWIAP